MSLSSNALCAKAKAMYGGRLNKNVYLDLTRKQTIGEVVSYLKSQTSYADALKDINIRHVHRGQIEDCLNQEYYHRCAKLMKYSPKSDEDFYLFEIIGVEINLIMDKLVSLQAKEQYSFNLSIPTYLAKKTSFNIDGLVNIESFKDLLQYLSKTRYYKVLKEIDFSVPFDVKEVHMCLQSLYYENIVETIKKHFKGSVQKDLLNILYTSIELKNISKIYRYKQYFHESEDSIRSSLFLQYSRLPKDMMNRLISASGPKEVLSLLSTSKYNFYMDDKEFAYIEYYADSIQYNIAKRYMRFSNSAPLVYMTYSILQRIEIDNLKHIVLGHLSKENNYESLAYETVKLEVTLGDNAYKGEDLNMAVAKRDSISEIITV